jgi:outer membrane protein OmpA-like peptidoglycan-associated protein
MENRMKSQVLSLAVVTLVLAVGTSAMAQGDKDRVFSDVDAARGQAVEANANVLAPATFERAEREYQKAVGYFERSGSSSRLTEQMGKAEAMYLDAEAKAETSAVELREALESREAARSVDAPEQASEFWSSGEKYLATAVKQFESGRLDAARDAGKDAYRYYRRAELDSIKADLLGEARSLIAKAKQLRVDRYAPNTLQLAEALLGQADAALNKDRYDHPPAIELAAQASYEARHATYIANEINLVKEGSKTEELLIRSWEEQLEELATEANVPVVLDSGPEELTAAIKGKLASMAESEVELRQQLDAQARQLESQSGRIAALEGELAEMDQLLLEFAPSNKAESMISDIEEIFLPTEAEVMNDERKGLVIRLIGLEFESGSAELPADSGVVQKLPQVIEAYPNRRVTIEGHTDSSGASDWNLQLSQARADSLREYLVGDLGYPENLVRSIGYGETKPIASNDDRQGQAKNRRIEFILGREVTTSGRQ